MPKKTTPPTAAPGTAAVPSQPFEATPAALGLPWRLAREGRRVRFLRADGQPALASAIDLSRDAALMALGPLPHRIALLQHVVDSVNAGEGGALLALDALATSGAISPRPGDTPAIRQAADAALATWQRHKRAGRALSSDEQIDFALWFEGAYHEGHAPIAPQDAATARHKNTAFSWALAGYRYALLGA